MAFECNFHVYLHSEALIHEQTAVNRGSNSGDGKQSRLVCGSSHWGHGRIFRASMLQETARWSACLSSCWRLPLPWGWRSRVVGGLSGIATRRLSVVGARQPTAGPPCWPAKLLAVVWRILGRCKHAAGNKNRQGVRCGATQKELDKVWSGWRFSLMVGSPWSWGFNSDGEILGATRCFSCSQRVQLSSAFIPQKWITSSLFAKSVAHFRTLN